MTTHETELLRRLEAFRKDDLLAGIILATRRIGGAGAVLSAIREAQSSRSRRAALCRHRAPRRDTAEVAG